MQGGPRREEEVEVRSMRASTNMTKVCKYVFENDIVNSIILYN